MVIGAEDWNNLTMEKNILKWRKQFSNVHKGDRSRRLEQLDNGEKYL